MMIKEVLRANLHGHSMHSDGEGTPEQIVKNASRLGFTWVAVSDHYTTRGVIALYQAVGEHNKTNSFPMVPVAAMEMGTVEGDLLLALPGDLNIDFLKWCESNGGARRGSRMPLMSAILTAVREFDAIPIIPHPQSYPPARGVPLGRIVDLEKHLPEVVFRRIGLETVNFVNILYGIWGAATEKEVLMRAEAMNMPIFGFSDHHKLWWMEHQHTEVVNAEPTAEGLRSAIMDRRVRPSAPSMITARMKRKMLSEAIEQYLKYKLRNPYYVLPF